MSDRTAGEGPVILPVHGSNGIPGSRLEIVDDAGHFSHVRKHVPVARLLIDFFNNTPPSRIRALRRGPRPSVRADAQASEALRDLS